MDFVSGSLMHSTVTLGQMRAKLARAKSHYVDFRPNIEMKEVEGNPGSNPKYSFSAGSKTGENQIIFSGRALSPD